MDLDVWMMGYLNRQPTAHITANERILESFCIIYQACLPLSLLYLYSVFIITWVRLFFLLLMF